MILPLLLLLFPLLLLFLLLLLPLLPLLQVGLVDPTALIVDSKSGVTGAGRAAKITMLFSEINESVKPYGLGGHRHVSEIEQEVAAITHEQYPVSFTPQIVPMSRGILSSLYLTLTKGQTVGSVKSALHDAYNNEPFVRVVDDPPATRDVHGTNQCRIGVFESRIPGKVTVLSVIDNLTKGSSGQAVQNMNLMFGLAEEAGLTLVPLFP